MVLKHKLQYLTKIIFQKLLIIGTNINHNREYLQKKIISSIGYQKVSTHQKRIKVQSKNHIKGRLNHVYGFSTHG